MGDMWTNKSPLAAPRFLQAAFAGAVLFAFSSGAFADEVVGRVLMAIGKVEIERGDRTIPVKKDTEVLPGDTIATGTTSNAQVRFKDGAVIALRPETEFRVDEYKYSGKPDGSEKASVSLLKGGVRAVTGAIGRSNRDNLKVNAVVATVGIRGTGFNIAFCSAACKAANPSANEGLYAGVFEGKVAVRNEGGATSDLGVNRFAYVKDGKTAPTLLIAPPSFLKDSLEGQVRIQPKVLALNAASENSSSLQNANATVKAPATGGQAETISADKVQKVPTPLTQIEVVNTYPSQFFDNLSPISNADKVEKPVGTSVFAFQSAEFNPSGVARLANNQVIQGVNSTTAVFAFANASNQVDLIEYSVTGGAIGRYSIRSAYLAGGVAATQQEGGAISGVIAWGRWADGKAFVQNYGVVEYTKDQGFHWIVGERVTNANFLPANQGNWTFNLAGGTTPTEAFGTSAAAWRLTGGRFSANLASNSVAITGGVLNLYFARSGEGFGNFDMAFSGTSGSVSSTSITGSVTRRDGTANLCTSACAATGALGFYGRAGAVSHAGMTYEFNSGSKYVQGVAVFSGSR